MRQPQPQLIVSQTIPAPMAGVSSESNLLAMQQIEAIYVFNLFVDEYGLKVRDGYTSASPAIPVEGNSQIRSVIGYRGTVDAGGADRLFAVTNQGIYLADTATQVQAFTTTSGNAGYGVSTTFVSIGGSYLYYADEVNGGFRYEEDLDTWLPIPDLTLNGAAFDPSSIVHVTSWKNRLWFTIRDSSVAYYLPVGQVSGALTPFDFGNKCPHGGSLIGIWSWTVEGGAGLNDYLVAISRGGDVLVYQGLDPSNAASFGIRGSWYLGALPTGRSIVYNYTGDLLVVTVAGVIRMSSVVRGTPSGDDDAYITRKINRFIREEMVQSKDSMGWSVIQHPRTGYLMVIAPPRAGVRPLQFVSTNGAWTVFRGMPISSIAEYLGELYFGTDFDNGHKLFQFAGNLDDGKPIEWSGLTSYQSYGSPGNFKQAQFIRPMFTGQMTPVYDVVARYDFDLDMVSGAPRLPDANIGIWDLSNWDEAVWGAGYTTDQKPYGATGLGRHIAIAFRGASLVPTTVLGFDVMMTTGGYL